MTADYAGLGKALLPEAALVAGALAVLAADLSVFRRRDTALRLRAAAAIAGAAIAAAVALSLRIGARGEVFGGVLVLDSLAVATRTAILVLALLAIGISTGGRAPRLPAEYVAIVLFGTCGLLLMAAAQQLLLAFLALELASLSLYVLAGFESSHYESAEAAVKYFLFGAMSAAFLLFGFSLLYGLSGSLDIRSIAAAIAAGPPSPMLSVALVMVLAAFGFKVAAAPFHLWAPDVYQGAPPSSTAFIASASKLGGFILFTRLLWPNLGGVTWQGGAGWIPVAAVMCGASLLLGNLAALAQTNLRRLLAYSAIAHAGGLFLGVIAVGAAGPGPLFYYAATYGVATAGAFGVIAVLDASGGCREISDLAGLRWRSPLLAGCLLIFILSLAGIPPLAGFLGKFAVFSAALRIGGLSNVIGWLALLAIALSAVALYYYLIVLKHAWVTPGEQKPVKVPVPAALALVVAAALLIFLGLFPQILLNWAA